MRLGERVREKGSLLVVAVFGLIALILALAVAVDVARFMRLVHQAQVVADEAALGAAHYLPDTYGARSAAARFIKQRWPHYNIIAEGGQFDGYAHMTDSAGQPIFAEIVNLSTKAQGADLWACCTISVSVQALFDPIFTPRWLYGNYATTGLIRSTTVFADWDDVPYPIAGPPPGGNSGSQDTYIGDFGLFIGGGGCDVPVKANNWNVCGSVYVSGTGMAINPDGDNNQGNNFGIECGGTFSSNGLDEDGKNNFGENANDGQYTTDIDSGAEAVPFPDTPNSINYDIVIDTNDATSPAFGMTTAHAPRVLTTTTGQPVMAGGQAVMFKRSAGDTFELIYPNGAGAGSAIDIASNPALGDGVDMKIVGNLNWPGSGSNSASGKDYEGSLWVTGNVAIDANNNDFRSGRTGTQGDNHGIVFMTGHDGDGGNLAINGNMSQLSITGLIKVDGSVAITGNASNNTYNIEGALWARSVDCSAGFDGNNWGINYNAAKFDVSYWSTYNKYEGEIRYRSNTPRARIIR